MRVARFVIQIVSDITILNVFQGRNRKIMVKSKRSAQIRKAFSDILARRATRRVPSVRFEATVCG